jgi:hypothetical protein
MVSKNFKMHNQVPLTILQKLEIMRRREIGESHNVIMVSYNTGLLFIYNIKKQRDQLGSFMLYQVKEYG